MTATVVDASTAVKWYLPEPHSLSAARLLEPIYRLYAPDLLYAEVGNVLWKRVLRNDISTEKAFTIIGALKSAPLHITETRLLAKEALEISIRVRRTFYDSLYLALASIQECPMVTADRRLYEAVKSGPLRDSILWVEEVR